MYIYLILYHSSSYVMTTVPATVARLGIAFAECQHLTLDMALTDVLNFK